MSARGRGTRQKRAGSGELSPPIDVPQGELRSEDGAAAGRADALDPELLGKVLDRTSARIAYYDRENRCRLFSPAFGRAVGAPPDQIIGRTLEEIGIAAAHRERLEILLAKVRETGRPVREVITTQRDGSTFDNEVALEPDLAPDGTVRGVVLTAWDVTELRRAVRRVAQLDRVYAILSDIDQAIVRIRDGDLILQEACRIAVEVGGFELAWVGLVEPNGDIRIAGRAGRDEGLLDTIIVSTRDEPSGHGVVGTSIREDRTVIVPDVEHDERMAAWREELTTLGFKTAAAFPLHRSGRPSGAFVLYSLQLGYFDAEETRLFEELVGDLSFALDSLEAERGMAAAEGALRESERRYRDLFQQSPMCMWVYEKETLRFLAVNDAAIDTYGYSADEFLAMTLPEIRPEEDVPALLAGISRPDKVFRRPGVWRHLRKDGSVIVVELTTHDIEFDGRQARLVSIIDVSERRRLEVQLAEATRLEAMGHLAGGIAHDFNNLLTAVNGYAELLVAELGDSPLAEDAREIRRAGGRAAELTRQVLAFARRQVLTPRPVDVNEVVAGVSQMLRRLIGEQIRLVTILDRRPAVVIADPGQLEQVLLNLAINARDAMPEGGALEIGVRRVEESAKLGRGGAVTGPAVLVTVTDTGVGMDQETLSRAFEPFFTTKQTGTGTGLGLSTVYGIVHQSGGEIWAESTVGRGTTISVLLGRVDVKAEPLPGPPQAATEDAGTATILVVEDDPAVRAFVVSTLEHAGYRVLVAGSPAQAVALTQGLDERIDLLLTNLIMPETDGQVLAERLLARRPSLRVVLMSGYAAGVGGVAIDGSHPFIEKPFGRDELTAIVAKTLAEPQTP